MPDLPTKAKPTALIVAVVAEMMMSGYGLGGAMMKVSRQLDSIGVSAGSSAGARRRAVIAASSAARRRLPAWHRETLEPATL